MVGSGRLIPICHDIRLTSQIIGSTLTMWLLSQDKSVLVVDDIAPRFSFHNSTGIVYAEHVFGNVATLLSLTSGSSSC